MKRAVLKFDIEDEKSKRKALKALAAVEGVDSVSIDTKEKKITVIGDMDPVYLTAKLRKFGSTELVSVGPQEKLRTDEKKEKKEEKKAEADKEKGKKAEGPINDTDVPSYRLLSDENPNACTIS